MTWPAEDALDADADETEAVEDELAEEDSLALLVDSLCSFFLDLDFFRILSSTLSLIVVRSFNSSLFGSLF